MHALRRLRENFPSVTLLLVLANVSVFAYMLRQGVHFEVASLSVHVALRWGANFNPFTLNGEAWRLLTSLFLHGGYLHLLVNMYALFSLGSTLEAFVGKRAFLALYLLCGIGGGLASLGWNVYTASVGASGAIFGLYGYQVLAGILDERQTRKEIIWQLVNLGIFVAVNLVFGTYMNVDHAGHFGGLFTGMLLLLFVEIRRSYRIYLPVFAEATLLFLLGFGLIFWLLPRGQVRYYAAFQELLDKERLSDAVLRGNYPTDQAYLDTLLRTMPAWEQTRQRFAALDDLPYELLPDQHIVLLYCSLRQESLQQRVNSLEKESYIYWDSIEVLNEQVGALPGLRYILNYQTVVPEEELPSLADTPPVLYPTKTYYDSAWRETDAVETAPYFRIGQKDSLGRWQGKVRDFYRGGAIQMKGYYKDNLKDGVFLYYSPDSTYEAAGVYKKEYKSGKWEYFYPNGKLERKRYYKDRTYTLHVWDTLGFPMVQEGNGTEIQRHPNGVISLYGAFQEGRRTGLWYGYHPNGAPYFEEYYDDGLLTKGISYDVQGKRFTYDINTLFPSPQGGDAALQAYLAAHTFLQTDTTAAPNSGEITVIFTVNAQGELYNFRFQDAPTSSYEWQAELLLRNGPAWLPARQYGQHPQTAETVVRIPYP